MRLTDAKLVLIATTATIGLGVPLWRRCDPLRAGVVATKQHAGRASCSLPSELSRSKRLSLSAS